ncbi:hypothetical protein QYM36_014692 [Artemia franciscana]|uniref:Uncharacterized protein n=1 Tax=Artemia franciscana TaxID=6661 RepID=A0AA88KYH0_ARTSF|nr:hypothetical protein QYM36_014692 [Artemia franciscana]
MSSSAELEQAEASTSVAAEFGTACAVRVELLEKNSLCDAMRTTLLLLSVVAFSPSLAAEIESTMEESVNGQARFIFITKTITNLIITTSTTSGGLRTWCYTVVSGLIPVFSTGTFSSDAYLGENTIFVNSASACRKRRWSFENPFDKSLKEILFPSAVAAKGEKGDITAAVTLDKTSKAADSDIESSRELKEIEPRFIKALSLIHTVTQTLTAISTIITTTQLKSVTLTCTPLELGLDPCPSN